MEEVIQELRNRSETTPVKLDLPTEDDLIDVEEQIYLTLPGDYREFLLAVSDLVLGSIEPATATDRQSHTYLPEIAANAWLVGLPRYLIPICEIPGGYFFIHEDGVVQKWERGTIGEQEWESIWMWAYDIWLGKPA